MTALATPHPAQTGPSLQDLFTPKPCVRAALDLIQRYFPDTRYELTEGQNGLTISIPVVPSDEQTRQTLTNTIQAIALQTHSTVALVADDNEPIPAEPISADPIIRTVVLDKAFSNVYKDLPTKMLADMYIEYTLGSALYSKPGEFAAATKELRGVLGKYLEGSGFKLISHTTFLQISVHGDAALIIEADYHELCRELKRANRCAYPVIITVMPKQPVAQSTVQTPAEPKVIAVEASRIAPRPTSTVTYELDTARSTTAPDQETLLALVGTARSLLKLKDDSSWLEVKAVNGEIELHLKAPISINAITAIERKLELLPVPVQLFMPPQAEHRLSISNIKSIIKLTLPATASLMKTKTKGEDDSGITFTIGVDPVDLLNLKEELSALEQAFAPIGQKLTFKYQQHESELAARLKIFHPKSLSTILRGLSAAKASLVPIEYLSFSQEKLGLSETVRSLTNTYISHGAREFRSREVLAFDIRGGGMHEDAFSIAHVRDKSILGVHVVNGAFLVGPTSFERFIAYDNGSSVYGPMNSGVRMLPGLHNYGFSTESPRPAISMFLEVSTEDFNAWVRGDKKGAPPPCEDVRFELTLVKLTASEHYDYGTKGCVYKGRYKNEAAALLQFASLIRALDGRGQIQRSAMDLDIQTILAYFNDKLIASLNGGFPLMYSVSSEINRHDLESFIFDLPRAIPNKHPIKALCQRGVEEILADSRLLSDLVTQFWTLSRTIRKATTLPCPEATPSTASGQLHLTSGYSSYVPANRSLRDISALIAQHQFNSARGMYPALSAPQVEILCKRAQEDAALSPDLRKDLLLFGFLQTCKLNEKFGMRATVTKRSQPGLEIAELRGHPCRITLWGGDKQLKQVAAKHNHGDTIPVWPTHYDVAKNELVCSLTEH